jgi:hypothetical protein
VQKVPEITDVKPPKRFINLFGGFYFFDSLSHEYWRMAVINLCYGFDKKRLFYLERGS